MNADTHGDDDIHNMTVEQYLQWLNQLNPQDIKKHFGNELTPNEARDLTESLAQMLNGETHPATTQEEQQQKNP